MGVKLTDECFVGAASLCCWCFFVILQEHFHQEIKQSYAITTELLNEQLVQQEGRENELLLKQQQQQQQQRQIRGNETVDDVLRIHPYATVLHSNVLRAIRRYTRTHCVPPIHQWYCPVHAPCSHRD